MHIPINQSAIVDSSAFSISYKIQNRIRSDAGNINPFSTSYIPIMNQQGSRLALCYATELTKEGP